MTNRSLKLRPAALRIYWLSTLIMGLVLGFVEVILALSLGSLLFTGPLRDLLPRGIGLALITATIHILVTSVFSSQQILIGSIQDSPATLLAVTVAAMVAPMAADDAIVPTVFALIMLATFFSGVLMTLMGSFKLGGLVRYIPYPVIGGFIGGTGWLLAQGSFGVMVNTPIALENLNSLLAPDQLILWLPGLVFALALFFGLRHIQHAFILPGLLIGGLAVFFAILFLSRTSIEMATAQGFMLGNSGSVAWQPLSIEELSRVRWDAIFGQIGNIGAVLVITTSSMLLNVTGIELALRKDIDLNRELKTVGIANLLAGIGGGTIGYPALSLTMLNQRIGRGGSRRTGIVAGIFCLFILIGGMAVLVYVPRFMLGGLLLYLGLDFLNEWVIQGYRKLGRLDYIVVLTIIITVIVAGFLVAVILGLSLMVALFAIQSSQVNIFRRAMNGDEVVSHVLRNAQEAEALYEHKKGIYLLELQGFMFFGTSTGIIEKVRERISASDQHPLKYLILDFRHIIGLDSSAAHSLNKVKYLADAAGFVLIFSNLDESRQHILARSGLSAQDGLYLFEDVHHALEWCEDQLLKNVYDEKPRLARTLDMQLRDEGLTEHEVNRLNRYLEKRQLATGDTLIKEGEAAADLYFIDSGQLSAYVSVENGQQMRIQTLTHGAVVGELAIFLNMPRTASVIADTTTVVYAMPRAALEAMTIQDPPLAIAVNQLVGRLISERLVAANRERAALNR